MNAPTSAMSSPSNLIDTHMYPRTVHMLAQTFFIRDHQQNLLLCAHKFDFDILLYDSIDTFVDTVHQGSDEDLFVVDLDCLNNLYDNRKLFLHDLLALLPEKCTGIQSGLAGKLTISTAFRTRLAECCAGPLRHPPTRTGSHGTRQVAQLG